MGVLTKKQLHELKHMLLEEKSELERHFADRETDDSLRISTGELSSVDNHPGDVGTEVFERSKDKALDEHAEKQLREVYNALARMETGEYGQCETCGKAIPFERLEVLPYTSYCVEHTPSRSVSERRPIEEDLIASPPGQDKDDDLIGGSQLDDVDAWSTVERYGNANSPAMSSKRQVESYDDLNENENENDGYVEELESFVATDLYGKRIQVVRGKSYYDYMEKRESNPGPGADNKRSGRRSIE